MGSSESVVIVAAPISNCSRFNKMLTFEWLVQTIQLDKHSRSKIRVEMSLEEHRAFYRLLAKIAHSFEICLLFDTAMESFCTQDA